MPVTTCAAMRDASHVTPCPSSIGTPSIDTIVNKQLPNPTRMCVRMPASLRRASRSKPMSPHSSTAHSTAAASIQLIPMICMAPPCITVLPFYRIAALQQYLCPHFRCLHYFCRCGCLRARRLSARYLKTRIPRTRVRGNRPVTGYRRSQATAANRRPVPALAR